MLVQAQMFVNQLFFKFGVLIASIRLKSFIPFSITLTFIEEHSGAEKLKLLQLLYKGNHGKQVLSVCQIWISSAIAFLVCNFYIREIMANKSCQYVKYGSVQQLLFWFAYVFSLFEYLNTG